MLARGQQLFLDELSGALAHGWHAEVIRAPTGLTVGASGPDGFDMAILVHDGAYTLSFDQWEETFDEPHHARALFEAALAGRARLRIDGLAGRHWRWTLERQDATGAWVAESTIGRPIWRFWGKPSVTYLRNSFADH